MDIFITTVQLLVGFVSETRIGHKWIIVVGILSNVITVVGVLLSPPGSIWLLQITEITVAVSFASHACFSAVRYHMYSKDRYQFVTALTRGCMLLGHVTSSLLGQGLYLLHVHYGVPLRVLFYTTIVSACPLLLIAILKFPPPSKYLVPMAESSTKSIMSFFKQVYTCYANSHVLFWSLFAIIANPVHHLAITYYQPLFKTLDPTTTSWNGLVIALAYLAAAILSLVPTRFETIFDNNVMGQVVAIILSCVGGACLLLMSQYSLNMVSIYALFITYHAIFELLIVLAMSQIAKRMKLTRFAAIFAFNATLQNTVQLVIQLVMGVLGLHVTVIYFVLAVSMIGVIPIILIVCMFVTRFIQYWCDRY